MADQNPNFENLQQIEESRNPTPGTQHEGIIAESVEDLKEETQSEDTLRGEVKELVGDDLSPEEYEELESVLYSISSGKVCIQSKNRYQAHSAAISSEHQVPVVLEYLNKRERFNNAKNKIYAYRVNQVDENTGNMELYEHYEDDGEEGAGEKLLHLLQKMGVENIFIVVCVWHYRMPGQLGTETYKLIIDRAKDLLTTLHLKVMEAERIEKEHRNSQALVIYDENVKSQKRIGKKVNPTVYPTNMIPDSSQKSLHSRTSKADELRPNNFMYGVSKTSKQHEDEDEPLEIDLTEDEYNYAVRMTEYSIRKLNKSHIIELRSILKPHPMVEKVLKMVCILRGSAAPTWRQAQEMMNDKTFLMELRLIDPVKVKQSIVKKILKILSANPNLTPDQVIKYSEGGAIASILLTWIINLIKWNAGHNRFIFDDATLAGGRIMNKELIAEKEDDEQQDDPFKRINAYGLMKKNEGEEGAQSQLNEDDYNSMGGKDYFDKSLANISDRRFKGGNNRSYMDKTRKSKKNKKKKKTLEEPKSRGKFVESKQMVFTDLQMLVPSTKSNEFFPRHQESHDPKANHTSHHDLKPVLQDLSYNPQPPNDNLHANKALYEEDDIRKVLDDMDDDKKMLLEKLSQSDEDILQYLNSTMLEHEPTEVLIKCAEILRERRQNLYPDQDKGEEEVTSPNQISA